MLTAFAKRRKFLYLCISRESVKARITWQNSGDTGFFVSLRVGFCYVQGVSKHTFDLIKAYFWHCESIPLASPQAPSVFAKPERRLNTLKRLSPDLPIGREQNCLEGNTMSNRGQRPRNSSNKIKLPGGQYLNEVLIPSQGTALQAEYYWRLNIWGRCPQLLITRFARSIALQATLRYNSEDYYHKEKQLQITILRGIP